MEQAIYDPTYSDCSFVFTPTQVCPEECSSKATCLSCFLEGGGTCSWQVFLHLVPYVYPPFSHLVPTLTPTPPPPPPHHQVHIHQLVPPRV